jgi:hypothetical protein
MAVTTLVSSDSSVSKCIGKQPPPPGEKGLMQMAYLACRIGHREAATATWRKGSGVNEATSAVGQPRDIAAPAITEINMIHLVLFGPQNRDLWSLFGSRT